MVHITMVSRNTSMMPSTPCSAGWSTWAEAWAMEAVPIPASLVNTPREAPTPMAVTMEPMRPPVTAFGAKAPWRMSRNAMAIRSARTIKAPRPSNR